MNTQKGFAPILLILVGLVVVGGGVYLFGMSKKSDKPSELVDKNVTTYSCEAFVLESGDDDGIKLLKDMYTEKGIGAWSEEYFDSELENLVILVDTSALSQSDNIIFKSSKVENEISVKVSVKKNVLDEDLNNPRTDEKKVQDIYSQSGYVRGYYFGTRNWGTEPCMFDIQSIKSL